MEFDLSKITGKLVECYSSQSSPSEFFDYSQIEKMVSAQDEEIRIWIAKALAFSPSNATTVQSLCRLAEDQDSLVRIEAIDSLSEHISVDSYAVLCSHFKSDDDELVRAYAAFGIALVGRIISPANAVALLLDAERTESSALIRVGIYEGLYILGVEDTLEKLFEQFQSNDYHVQCFTIRALAEVINPENSDLIALFINTINTDILPTPVWNAFQELKEVYNEVLEQ